MLTERGAAGEAGGQADSQPAWRDICNGGDGGRLGDHVPEAGMSTAVPSWKMFQRC